MSLGENCIITLPNVESKEKRKRELCVFATSIHPCHKFTKIHLNSTYMIAACSKTFFRELISVNINILKSKNTNVIYEVKNQQSFF